MNRLFEILKDGKWVKCSFQDIKAGDLFRAYEQEEAIIYAGKPVVFEASTDAKQKNETWCIEIKEPTESLIRRNIYGEF